MRNPFRARWAVVVDADPPVDPWFRVLSTWMTRSAAEDRCREVNAWARVLRLTRRVRVERLP